MVSERRSGPSSHLRRVVSVGDQSLSGSRGPPIAEISAAELLAAVRKVEHRGAYDLAHRILQVASQVFRYGVATARCERDSAPDLRRALTPHKGKNQAAVKPDEIPKLLEAIGTYAQIGDR